MEANKNTKSINISMPPEMIAEFEKRADTMHLFTSEYCNVVLADWLSSNKKLMIAE